KYPATRSPAGSCNVPFGVPGQSHGFRRSRPHGARPWRCRLRRIFMRDVFVCDAARTPIGRYGGALAKVRTDDLAAVPIRELVKRNPKVDWSQLDEVYFGCA